MQKYRCHKIVEAQDLATNGIELTPDSAHVRVRLKGELIGDIPTRAIASLSEPEIADGYLVKYKDGYTSWSPRKAFEEGYAPIPPDAQ